MRPTGRMSGESCRPAAGGPHCGEYATVGFRTVAAATPSAPDAAHHPRIAGRPPRTRPEPVLAPGRPTGVGPRPEGPSDAVLDALAAFRWRGVARPGAHGVGVVPAPGRGARAAPDPDIAGSEAIVRPEPIGDQAKRLRRPGRFADIHP